MGDMAAIRRQHMVALVTASMVTAAVRGPVALVDSHDRRLRARPATRRGGRDGWAR
jgi:hypothetical protein